MKQLFIEARKKFGEIDLSKLNDLSGETISIAATVQYLDLLPKIKSHLESLGKKVILQKGAKYEGHVLGCNSSAFDKNADTLLLITDGKFHGLNNAFQLQKELYIYNGDSLTKIEQKEIDTYNKQTEAKKKKFLMAETVGILLSTKPGQKQNAISTIKKKIEKLNKKVYVFESNRINYAEFENFPQIQIWVNTACFGISSDDKRIINLQDITEFL